MKSLSSLLLFSIASLSPVYSVDYKKDILPIMKERCWDCHSNDNEVKGNLALDDLEEVRDYQVGKYNIIRPGNPDESNFLERLTLDTSHNDFMPRKAERIPQAEIEKIEAWIKLGAVIDAENPTEDETEWVKKSSMKSGETDELPSAEPEFQMWTSSEGKAIQAQFLSMKEGVVTLLLKNGQKAEVPVTRLNAESQKLAADLAAGRG